MAGKGLMPPGGDGGLHIHTDECLLEGMLEVTIGSRDFTLMPGETYFAPRSIAQRLRNPGKMSARGLAATTPGGFDAFVTRAGFPLGAEIPASPPSANQMDQLRAQPAEFGIISVAPPGTSPVR